MSRYIDAEPLDKEISSWITDDRGGNLEIGEIVFNETLVDCLEAISKQPTADVVSVVRCKDCKYKRGGGFKRSEKDGWSVEYILPCGLGDDGFCSKGEKADEQIYRC